MGEVVYGIKCQEINVSHPIISSLLHGSVLPLTDFKSQGCHILWAFAIQPGSSAERMLLLHLPIVIFVVALYRRRSNFVHGTSIPNQGLLSEVQSNHNYLILSALEKRWKSRIGGTMSSLRCNLAFSSYDALCVPPVLLNDDALRLFERSDKINWL